MFADHLMPNISVSPPEDMQPAPGSVLCRGRTVLVWILIIAGLYLSSLYSYSLFHVLAEVFSITVAVGIFMLAWNSRSFMKNDFLVWLGIAYVFVAGIDLFHMMAFKGLDVFSGYGSNAPTQLWIAARYLESVAWLTAPLFFKRRLRPAWIVSGLAAAFCLVLLSVFYWQNFPACFIESTGLTPFKVASEYVISLIILGGWVAMRRQRERFDRNVYKWLTASLFITIAAEMSFTLYTDVYGLSNLIGHVLKIVSFFVLYKAIIETGLVKPYQLLFKELRDSEQAFQTQRDFAENLIETAHAVVLVLDVEGRIVRYNSYLEEISGYRLDEVRGRDWATTFLPERDRDLIQELISEAIADISTQGNVNPILTKQGEERQIEWYDRVLRDKRGEITGLLAVGIDVTERRRAEEERLIMEGYLRHGQRLTSIGTLASGVAHEINNPLMGILNYAELIGDNVDGEPLEGYAQTILREGNRIAVIVRNLLLFSRQTSGTKSPTDIREIIEGALSLIGSVLRKDQITLTTCIPDDLPLVTCNGQQIQQVIINLLINARDALNQRYQEYHKDKKAKVKVRLFDKSGSAWIRLTFEDHGIGIPEDVRSCMFDPFFTTKPRNEGAGLGLSVSFGIVRDHNGEMTVESHLNERTRFHVDLPVGGA